MAADIEELRNMYVENYLITCGPGSSVSVATDYRLDSPGSNPSGDEIFRLSRPALGPTQSPVKLVPGLSRGCCWPLTPSSATVMEEKSYTSAHPLGHTGPVMGSVYFLLTHSLTPWSRVLLKKLTGSQLVKKFPEYHGTQMFITAFTSFCHLSLYWVKSIQSMSPTPLPEDPS